MVSLVTKQHRTFPKWVKVYIWILLIGGLTVLLVLFLYLLSSYPLSWYQKNIGRAGQWLKSIAYIFPLIGSSLLLITFTIDRLIASRIRRRDARRNWYTKAFIDPNLKEIRTFFSHVYEDYKSSVKVLKQSQKYNSTNDQEYILLKAKQTEVISIKVRKLNFELVSVILSTNPKIALEIQVILLEVSNFCTEGIDILDEDYDKFHQRLGEWQGQMMHVLADPLSK